MHVLDARVARPFTKHEEGVHTQRGDDSANGCGEQKQQRNQPEINLW